MFFFVVKGQRQEVIIVWVNMAQSPEWPLCDVRRSTRAHRTQHISRHNYTGTVCHQKTQLSSLSDKSQSCTNRSACWKTRTQQLVSPQRLSENTQIWCPTCCFKTNIHPHCSKGQSNNSLIVYFSNLVLQTRAQSGALGFLWGNMKNC